MYFSLRDIRKCPSAVRLICATLLITSFYHDLIWAYPDALQIELRTTRSEFKDAFAVTYALKRAGRIADAIESANPTSLGDIAGFLAAHTTDLKGTSYEMLKGEWGVPPSIIIKINNGDIAIRYYAAISREPAEPPPGYVSAACWERYCGLADRGPVSGGLSRQLLLSRDYQTWLMANRGALPPAVSADSSATSGLAGMEPTDGSAAWYNALIAIVRNDSLRNAAKQGVLTKARCEGLGMPQITPYFDWLVVFGYLGEEGETYRLTTKGNVFSAVSGDIEKGDYSSTLDQFGIKDSGETVREVLADILERGTLDSRFRRQVFAELLAQGCFVPVSWLTADEAALALHDLFRDKDYSNILNFEIEQMAEREAPAMHALLMKKELTARDIVRLNRVSRACFLSAQFYAATNSLDAAISMGSLAIGFSKDEAEGRRIFEWFEALLSGELRQAQKEPGRRDEIYYYLLRISLWRKDAVRIRNYYKALLDSRERPEGIAERSVALLKKVYGNEPKPRHMRTASRLCLLLLLLADRCASRGDFARAAYHLRGSEQLFAQIWDADIRACLEELFWERRAAIVLRLTAILVYEGEGAVNLITGGISYEELVGNRRFAFDEKSGKWLDMGEAWAQRWDDTEEESGREERGDGKEKGDGDARPNKSYGEGVYRRHEQADAAIAYFPKTILRRGRRYREEAYEKHLERDADSPASRKVAAAIEILKEHAEALPWRRPLRKFRYLRRADELERETTVVALDMPSRLLLSGKDRDGREFYQFTHIGRHKKIIYIPGRLLDSLDAGNREDMEDLATILNHDQMEIDRYCALLRWGNFFKSFKRKVQSYEEEKRSHVIAMKEDPFGGCRRLERRRMAEFMAPAEFTLEIVRDEMIQIVGEMESINQIIAVHREKLSELYKKTGTTTRPTEKLSGPEEGSWAEIEGIMLKLRANYSNLADLYNKRAYLQEMRYERKAALASCKAVIDTLAEVEEVDTGLLPVENQVRVIYLCAKTGAPQQAAEEFRNLVEHRFMRKRGLSMVEIHLYALVMKNFANIKANLLRILNHQFEETASTAKRQMIGKAVSDIENIEYTPERSIEGIVSRFRMNDSLEEASIFGKDIKKWAREHGLVKDGKLFGGLEMEGLRLKDLPVWPVDKRGNILVDAIEWMREQGKAPPRKYWKASKVSITGLMGAEAARKVERGRKRPDGVSLARADDRTLIGESILREERKLRELYEGAKRISSPPTAVNALDALKRTYRNKAEYLRGGGVARHCHTSATPYEAELSPMEIVDYALRQGISTLYVTDHNGLEGSLEAVRYASDHKQIVAMRPAVEIAAPIKAEDGSSYPMHWKIIFGTVTEEDKAFVKRVEERTHNITLSLFNDAFNRFKRIDKDDSWLAGISRENLTVLNKSLDRNFGIDEMLAYYKGVIGRVVGKERALRKRLAERKFLAVADLFGNWTRAPDLLNPEEWRAMYFLIPFLYDQKGLEEVASERLFTADEVLSYFAGRGARIIAAHPIREVTRGVIPMGALEASLISMARNGFLHGLEIRYRDNSIEDDAASDALLKKVEEAAGVKLRGDGSNPDFHAMDDDIRYGAEKVDGAGRRYRSLRWADVESYFDDGEFLARPYVEKAKALLAAGDSKAAKRELETALEINWASDEIIDLLIKAWSSPQDDGSGRGRLAAWRRRSVLEAEQDGRRYFDSTIGGKRVRFYEDGAIRGFGKGMRYDLGIMRQPNGTEFYITEERIQHIPGYSGAAYVQIILVDENGNDAGGVSFECDYKKKRLTGKTKWFEPKLSRRYRVTADHIEHILSRWLKENSIVDRAVPDMPPPAGAKVFFGAGNSLFVRIFNSGDWWEGISLAMRRKLFPDEGVLSLPTPSVDVDILQGAILQDVTPPCAILPGTTLREATSSAATTAQPETTAASPSDTAPRATPAETLRNFVVNGRVESKKVSKEKAAHLAAQFDKVCGEHSLMPASPVLSLPRVIRWDADLNDVNSYSAFGLNLIYFKDVFNPTVGYFMLTDGKGMIGYGVSEGVGTEARFRFQVFPEFRKGPGVFVLRLISWKLYREFPRSTRFVFLRLELMSDKDMVKAALESGLPKFLMKNGFVAEGDTSDLTKCDFAFYIDSRKEDKAARGQPGRTEVIATIQTNELGRGRVAPRRTSPIFAQGFKVYLSENLFRPEDISALKSVLREEVVEIAAPAAIMVKATNPTRATKIGCIVTKEDFDTYWQPSARANSNKATMLAVDISDAGEAKDRDLANIYLENMVRLVAAMADDPQDAARETKIRYYVSVLFLGDKSSADALEKYLKDNDSAAFAALAALRFKPMRRMDPKTIETYKINVNKLLESA